MIALSRHAVRQFRLVARKGAASGRPRGLALPVRISAEKERVTLAAHLGDVVVAWRMSAPGTGGSGSLHLPLSELERFEGTRPDAVTLEARSTERGMARWQVGDAPCTSEFALTPCDLVWPKEPDHLISLPPTFPQALHEAGRTAARESGKYADHGIQVRGKAGQLIATDGKQALIQGGFVFPFEEDLLIPAVPLFGSREIACERAVSVGRNKEWLSLVIGPWQVWLRIDPEGRFPDVMAAIPRASGTRLVVDDADAQRVLEAIPELPDNKEEFPTVTLDLGRQIAIRARHGDDGEIVEVPLRRSRCKGPEVLVPLNRIHLGRALALGFREFRCADSNRPLVARDSQRTYLTATLDPKLAVPRASATVPVTASGPSPLPIRPQPDPSTFSRSSTMPSREPPTPERNGHAEAPGEGGLDPLAEAEGLRVALADVLARVGRLVTALRGFRKQHKTVTSALASLKSLRLD